MKKIRKNIFMIFVFIYAAPTHGMFMRARQRLQPGTRNVSSKAEPTAAVTTKRDMVSGQSVFTASFASKISDLRAQVARFLKEQYARLWKKEPAFPSKELSVPIAQVKQPDVIMEKPLSVFVNKPLVAKSDAQIESEEILSKLRGPNPWDYPKNIDYNSEIALKSTLAKQIEDFLQKNSAEDIESVFSHLITTSEGSVLLREMCDNYNELASKILPLIEKNADKVDDVLLIGTVLLLTSPEQLTQEEKLIEKFFKMADDNILIMNYDPEDISKLLPKDTVQSIRIIKIICDAMPMFITGTEAMQNRYDQLISFLTNTFAKKMENITNDNLKKLVKVLFAGDLKNTDSLLFGKLILNNPTLKRRIVDHIKRENDLLLKSLGLEWVFINMDRSDLLGFFLGIDSNYDKTPSYRHLKKYYQGLKAMVGIGVTVFNQIFTNMIQGVVRNEKELIDSGYEVFYHGRRWEYQLLSDIYARFYSYKSGEELKDFIFTHLDDPVLGKIQEKFFESEQKMREKLLAQGNFPVLTGGSFLGKGSNILFLSKYIFGNFKDLGCNSMQLMLGNQNWGELNLTTQEIFSMFGYSDIYYKYKKELDNLEKEHKTLSEHGELLQMAIPKSDVDKCIYNTEVGAYGPKRAFNIPGVGETDDIKTILDYVDKNPVDRIELILINTRDTYGGLNPKGGKKVFSHNLADPAAMAAFMLEQKQLFDRILESCKQRDEQEKKKAIEEKKAQLASE